MLARRHRLTKKDNIPSILETGGKAMGKLMVLRFRKSEKEENRFSVIITEKIAKKAVARNRLKRQIYEVIRLNQDKFPTSTQFDILILPKKAIIGATFQDIEADLLPLLKKLPS